MFRKALYLVAALLLMSAGLIAQPQQTFNSSSGGLVPDNMTWAYYPITVSGLNQTNIDTFWGLEKITLTITHTWDSDLDVWLVSPDSTEVLLFSGVGGNGQNFTNTAFKKNYPTPISSGSAPFTGNFKPMGDIGLFNNGKNGNGIWRLKILDTYPGADQGNVISWSIRFGNDPAKPDYPITSNLPIIKINTHGVGIPDDPKIAADFFIIDNASKINHANDTTYAYQGNIGIEQRGSSSAWAPKKSYGFETWNPTNIAIDTPLLGMPSQSDWILSASYYDKSLMRNVLAYHIANQTGHYAPRTRYCEVYLNNQYQGIYVLMEKIKRDNNRVDIAKLTTADTTGDALTGGYILKIDKFTGSGGDGFNSNFLPANPTNDVIFYQYEYPKSNVIQPQQKTYIKNYIDSFETALFGSNFQDEENGFRRFAGERSFMDYMFLNEISKNVDGYRLSTFLHKDKASKGGKVKMGPAWDFDIAFYNANYCEADRDTGWAYNFNYPCPGSAVPAWWERLRQDTLFNQRARCRWNYLRSNTLHLDTLFAYIDSTVSYINAAQQRNFSLWGIIGTATWPQPSPIPQSYAAEVQRLKQWLENRLLWLDQQFNLAPQLQLSVSLGSDTALCAGNPILLTPGSFESYQWSTGQTNSTVAVSQTGSYAVTVNDKFNCTGSSAINAELYPLPVATFQTSIVTPTQYQFLPTDTIGSSQWYFGDGDSSTQKNPTHNYPQLSAAYTVKHMLTDSNGCVAIDTFVIQVVYVGIANLGADDIVIYPNPAKEYLVVKASEQIEEITIRDFSGRICVAQNFNNTTEVVLPVNHLAAGVYMAEIKMPNGRANKRFVVRKTE